MKKLLLGLCLTVGISGMSLANGIEIDNANDSLLNASIENIEVEETMLLNCYYGYKTSIIGCDGSRTSVNLGGHTGQCGEYEEGSLVIVVTAPIDGCENGPLDDFNEALDWITPII